MKCAGVGSVLWIALLGALVGAPTSAQAAPISPLVQEGELLAVGSGLYLIDPASGNRFFLSGQTGALELEAARSVLVFGSADGCSQLSRLDPVLAALLLPGALAPVSSGGAACLSPIGSGPLWSSPQDLAFESATAVVLADADLNAVLRVALSTGDRAEVSGSVGSGPAFVDPSGLAFESAGVLLVADPGRRSLLRVDASSGNRSTLSGCPVPNCIDGVQIGSGVTMRQPRQVAVEAGGSILVADRVRNLLFRIDPATGDRTSLAAVAQAQTVAIEADGGILVGSGAGEVVRVDPLTGGTTVVSSASQGIGIGPDPGSLNDAVVATESDDPSTDLDGDGVAHASDNCVLMANPDQYDVNLDGFGNLCDADFSDDGFTGANDFNILRSCMFKMVGPGQGPGDDPTCAESDMDGDGVVGGPDFNQLRLLLGKPVGPSGLRCAGTIPCSAP